MAALCKNVLRSLNIANKAANCGIAVHCKRFLRVDSEEEIERLYISKTFDQRQLNVDLQIRDFRDVGKTTKKKNCDGDGPANLVACDIVPRSGREDARLGGIVPIPQNIVAQDSYLYSNCSTSVINVLHHYNVYGDLFQEDVMFTPDPNMQFKVAYDLGDDQVLPVFVGNKVPPHVGCECPLVGFTGDAKKLYSVLFINLDGHLSSSYTEYLHWSCLNMHGEEGVTSGSHTDYLQPIPLRGTGFHRYVYVLLEHSTEIESSLLPNIVKGNLNSRSFNFSNFFSKTSVCNGAVPVGIRFFQSEWDSSVREVFHHVLDMPEPAFEYDYPVKQHPVQVKYAHRQPFEKYLDMYRDKKEVAEEVLKEHLSEITPFKSAEEQQLPYPLATPTKPGIYADKLPVTWIRNMQKDKVNKTYKYKYITKGD